MVLCEAQKKVLGELVEAEFLAGSSQTVNLDGGLHCGIDQKLLESRVRLHGFGHLFLAREEDKDQQNLQIDEAHTKSLSTVSRAFFLLAAEKRAALYLPSMP